MSSRSYSLGVVGLLLLVFATLLGTGHILLPVEYMARDYPYRAYPPISGMGPFLDSWGLGDSVLGSYPALTYIHQAFSRGEFPLWNPLEALGLPAVASFGLGYMFPIHWLTFGLLPPLLAWHVELFAILLLSSLSSFALVRRLTGDAESAALAATAWSLGGWSGAYLQLPSYAWSLALFPFLLLCVEWGRERRPFAYLLLALGVMGMLTVGHLQVVAPAAVWVTAWIVWRGRSVIKGLFAAGLAGVMMASYHLIPMIELLRLSEREQAPLETILNALMLPREFLCMVFPTLMGQPSDNFYFGTLLANPVINSREHCVFTGVLVLVLALLAFWRKADPSSRPLGAVAAFLFLIAGAPWLYGPICRAIPQLLFLTPTRFLPFALFALCLLAAQGWSDLRRHPLRPGEARGLTGVLALFSLGALSFILPAMMQTAGFVRWLSYWATKNYAAKPPFFEGDFGPVFIDRVVSHFSLTSPAIALSFAVVAGCGGLLLRHVGKPLPFRAAFGLLLVDLAMFFGLMNPAFPVSGYFPSNPDIDFLREGTTLETAPAPPGRVSGLGDGPSPNLLLVERISNFEAYESAHPGDYRQLVNVLNRGIDLPHQMTFYLPSQATPEGLLDLLGLATVYNQTGTWPEGFPAPQHRGAIEALRRPGALRAFTLARYRVVDRSGAWKLMMEPGFQPREELLLDSAPSYPNPETPRFALVTPTHYSGRRVEFALSNDHPTTLVLTDLHYPGWRATVNGQTRPLHKAFGFARAVELPQGPSQVVLEYIPTGFPYTPWLAVLVFSALVGHGLGQFRARKERAVAAIARPS